MRDSFLVKTCDLNHNFAVWQSYGLFLTFDISTVNDRRGASYFRMGKTANGR